MSPLSRACTCFCGYNIRNDCFFFSEGLAVFISETLLSQDFGDYANYDTQEEVKHFYEQKELFTLEEVFALQIGESISKPIISYPEASSIIEYLYGDLGADKFFELYAALKDE